MKPIVRRNEVSGLTLIEVIIVLVIIGLLLGLLLPALARSGRGGGGIACLNNLKQISLAMRMWANENEERFPWQVDPLTGANRAAVDYFRAISNELSSPKVLACNTAGATKASSWLSTDPNGLPNTAAAAATHISYFLNVDARATSTNGLLTGDANITNLTVSRDGFVLLAPTSSPQWSEGRHSRSGTFGRVRPMGHIAFTDGSVRRLDSKELRDTARVLVPATNRLVLP